MASAASSVRLFLALWPDEGTRSALAGVRDRWSWPPGASPTPSERLHMTLHFLGPVAVDRLAALSAALASVDPVGNFTLEIGRAELWPAGIAVVCPLSTPQALLRLHAGLADAIGKLALPVDERPFRAHVTLARRASRAVPPADGPAVPWKVRNGFALVHSVPGGQGYRVLQAFR